MEEPANPYLASITTRRWIYAFAALVSANFVIHLFPVSLISLFGWYPVELNDGAAEFERVMASMEFCLVVALVAVLSVALTLFVFLRDLVQAVFVRRGRFLIHVRSYLLLLASPLAALYFVFRLIPQGPEAFVGTRAAGMSFGFLMLVVSVVVAGSLLVIRFALEPEKAEASLRDHWKQRYSGEKG